MGYRLTREGAELGRAKQFIRELLQILDRHLLGMTLFADEQDLIRRARAFVEEDNR